MDNEIAQLSDSRNEKNLWCWPDNCNCGQCVSQDWNKLQELVSTQKRKEVLRDLDSQEFPWF